MVYLRKFVKELLVLMRLFIAMIEKKYNKERESYTKTIKSTHEFNCLKDISYIYQCM